MAASTRFLSPVALPARMSAASFSSAAKFPGLPEVSGVAPWLAGFTPLLRAAAANVARASGWAFSSVCLVMVFLLKYLREQTREGCRTFPSGHNKARLHLVAKLPMRFGPVLCTGGPQDACHTPTQRPSHHQGCFDAKRGRRTPC